MLLLVVVGKLVEVATKLFLSLPTAVVGSFVTLLLRLTDDPLSVLLLLLEAAVGSLMSNLGTDFNPASLISGRFTCGTGVLLLRSE